MKKHAFRIGLVVTMLLGLMMISANAECAYTNPHPVSAEFDHATEGWTALTNDNSALQDGNWYLEGDVTIDHQLQVLGEVTICLNGHELDLANASTSDGQQLRLAAAGAKLHICDCHAADAAGSITSSATYSSSAKNRVQLISSYKDYNNCEVHLWNGSLTGVTCGAGGAAVRFDGASNLLHIHGGKITGNKDISNTNLGAQYGGAINFRGANCTLEMCDGLIDGNTTNSHGAAIYLHQTATINVTGGTISNNKASTSSKYGGVLYLYSSSSNSGASDSVINLTGGTITGNHSAGNGGVICVTSKATGVQVNLGGDVKITGNTSGGSADNNIMYLANATTSVTGGTYSDDITNLTPDTGYVTYDNGDGTFTVYKEDEVPEQPEEPTGEDIHNDGSEWFPYVPGETELEANKNYYLADEVVGSAELITLDKSITLCLHGHSLQSSRGGGNFSVSIPAGVTVNLQDCDVNDTEGTISPATDIESARGVYVAGTLNMYGGTITGFDGGAGNGAGVQVANGGKMNMYGGVISKNVTTGSGGGVCVNQNGVFNMYDGSSITENEAATGGGVYAGGGSSATYAKSNATVNMYGGTISKNTATNGGGVALQRGHLSLSDKAAIDDNTATDGGGVRAYLYCTVTMTGGSIKNNEAATGAGISARTSGKITLNDGIIANNEATDSGAAMYLNTNNIVTMLGGHIYGNTNSANDVYGAVYLTSGNTITVTGGSFGLDEKFEPAPNGKIGEAYAAASAIGVVAANDEAIISGGSFYTRYSAELGADPCFAQSAGAGTITVTGGYFSTPLAAGLASGYMSYKVSDSANSHVPYCVAPVAAVSSNVGVGNSLAMSFEIANLPGVAADYVVTVNGNEATMTKDGNNFKITYTGVAAKDMDDEITLIITNNDTSVCEATDSIKGYADRVLADDTASDALKNAVCAMLYYGDAAQTYFGVTNAGLTTDVAQTTSSYNLADAEAHVNVPESSVYVGSSLSLKDEIILNLYFKEDVETVEVSGVSGAAVAVNGKEAVVTGIKLTDADEKLTITINGTDEVTDSIAAYAFRANNLAPDAAAEAVGLADLCQAMMNFVASVGEL